AHACHAVIMKDSHVLECTPPCQKPLHNHCRFSCNVKFLLRHLADDSCRQGRSGEGDTVEHLLGQTCSAAGHPHSVLAKLDQGFKDMVSEGLLRVDAQLGKYVMLSLYAGNCLIHIGKDGSLKQVPGSALPYYAPEHFLIECLGDGFPF